MSAYSELLKDPRWQRKRLEVMQREKFTCEVCKATNVTLNVHHGYYEFGLAPWDYDNDTLHCICEVCHQFAEVQRKTLRRLIGALPQQSIFIVKGFALGLKADSSKLPPFDFIANNDYGRKLVAIGYGFSILGRQPTEDEQKQIIAILFDKNQEGKSA